jgi:IclR family acetate operon transcriptional repressor
MVVFSTGTGCSYMNKYEIPNLARACQVLKMFAASDETLGASEVARRMSMPRTTALRVLHTLADAGLLARDGVEFRAGNELLFLGLRALGSSRIRELSLPVLRELSVAAGETSHVALLAGDKSLIAAVCDSPNPVYAASRAGTLADIHASATGKIFLAFAIRDSLRTFLGQRRLAARTEHTLTSVDALELECARVARNGYAVDNEEYHPGVRCLAAPVWDAEGNLAAAIGITASTVTFPRKSITDVAQTVLRAARDLSTALGHRTSRRAP